ncbi:MAG: amino acid ABC transporter permease, partial [Pseudomonadota bacterium]
MSDTQANPVAFVRTAEIPASPPPGVASGPLKWMRDNLFATPANGVLTLVALYAIYLILAPTLPWILNGVWNASSLAECREILAGRTGACFAVLSERWPQLLFGFKYPADLYWRPTVAFILLFVAVAPVLFFDLPRKLLIFTGLYPFIAFYLIWGGTILAPLLAMAGFAAGYVVFQRFVAESFALGFFGSIATALVVWAVGSLLIPEGASENAWMRAVPSRDLGGFMLNMMLGVTCVSLSLPIGIALALGRQSNMPLIKFICVIFIEFIRGVPLITLLFVASVMLSYFFPP